MLIVAIGWLFVVGLFALVQLVSPQGSLLVALLLVFGAGMLPLAVVLYVMGAPGAKPRGAGGAGADRSRASPLELSRGSRCRRPCGR